MQCITVHRCLSAPVVRTWVPFFLFISIVTSSGASNLSRVWSALPIRVSRYSCSLHISKINFWNESSFSAHCSCRCWIVVRWRKDRLLDPSIAGFKHRSWNQLASCDDERFHGQRFCWNYETVAPRLTHILEKRAFVHLFSSAIFLGAFVQPSCHLLLWSQPLPV